MAHEPANFDEVTEYVERFSPGSFFADRFRIEREVGSGGMGTVYEATDLTKDERVAVKVLLRPPLGKEEEAYERFQREARILLDLEHPNIVSIRGFGQAGAHPWIALELLDGQTLRELVDGAGPMSPAALAPIVEQTCAALTAAHERGVIHRDLKPDNIFVAADGTVRLLDFGLSFAHWLQKVTKSGTLLGTPRYMAPEVIASVASADHRADVYALGVILYEALAGSSPFEASDHGQLLGAILQQRQRPLTEVRPDLPSELEHVLARAMSAVDDRYPDAQALASAFAAAARIAPAEVGLAAMIGAPRVEAADPLDPITFEEGEAVDLRDTPDTVRLSLPDEPLRFSAAPSSPPPAAEPRPAWAGAVLLAGLLIALAGLALVLIYR